MGRRYALSAAQRAPLIEALTAGATYRDACGKVGIPWQTWCRWCREVRDGVCEDPDVTELVTEARRSYAGASVGLVATVRVASKKDWKAAAFLLQHRIGSPKARHDARRARYEAEIAKHRAEGTHVERIATVTKMSDAELDAELDRIAHEGRQGTAAPAPAREGTQEGRAGAVGAQDPVG